MYVDELPKAVYLTFQELTRWTLGKFEAKPRVYDQFDFFGAHIRIIPYGSFTMTQQYYARKLNLSDVNGTFEQF